jgi:signal transduction histidine kinase
MKDPWKALEALFGREDSPGDPSGVLACVRNACSAWGPEALAVARESGEVLAYESCGSHSWKGADIEQARRRLSGANVSTTFTTWQEASYSTNVALCREIDGQNLYFFACFQAFHAAGESEHATFVHHAEIALHAVAAATASSELRSRVLHLRNEQEMLIDSHHRIVAELIETRERQVRKERESVAVLEAEVEKRSEQLRLALRQTQLASEAKGAFLANVSHEIRTPMTAVLGYAELLLEGDATPQEVIEYARTIRRNGEHLLQILNDILDISKIEANKISVERIESDPRRIVDDAVCALQLRAEERGIAIEMEFAGNVPALIHTDPTRLRQVLVNLIANAVKFTEAGSVRICSRYSTSGGGRLEIDVIDTGIGMSEEQVARLFQPFGQADSSTTRRFGGTGLGLCISKNLAELMGGTLTVTSIPGAGSTFHVTVPTAAPGEGNADSIAELFREER